MLGKNSAIAHANEIDNANFQSITRDLGAMALLPDDVERLYALHHDAIARHLTTVAARTAGALFVLCRKHLVLGATALFRLYSAQMYRESRAAVEAAGIARLIQIDSEALRVFGTDDGSEAARKLARSTFAPKRLFPDSVPEVHVLSEFYDTASRLSHTSGLTFVRHLSQPSTTGDIAFAYQDILADNINRELPIHVLWLCQAHMLILVAADNIFTDVKANLEDFKRERSAVFQRLVRFNAVREGAASNE